MLQCFPDFAPNKKRKDANLLVLNSPCDDHHGVGIDLEACWVGDPFSGQPDQDPRDEPDDHEDEEGAEGLGPLVPVVEVGLGVLGAHPDGEQGDAEGRKVAQHVGRVADDGQTVAQVTARHLVGRKRKKEVFVLSHCTLE